jgi:hypothetical protein
VSDWNYGRPADVRFDAPRPSWPDGSTYPYPLPFPLAQAVDDDEMGFGGDDRGGDDPTPTEPFTREPDDYAADHYVADQYAADQFAPDQFAAGPSQPTESSVPWPPAPVPSWLREREGTGDPANADGGREHGDRRWLMPAGLIAGAAALGGVAVLVLVTGGHPAPTVTNALTPSTAPTMMVAQPPKSQTPKSQAPSAGAGAPLTPAQAQAVLSQYTTTNNSANAQRSDTLLASIESGSSYPIDAGLYRRQLADGTHYPAFGPVQATYYIPRDEPAGSGPRWFVVQVANAFQSSPATVTSDEYLLFTQPAPGGAWLDTIEPYLLASATAPQVVVGSDGLATAVSPSSTALTVAPGKLPAATASSIDAAVAGQPAVAVPGNLADRSDQKLWQAQVPGGTVTDAHTAAAGADGQEFALLTAGGGALVFYTDAARLTITPPAGSTLQLNVPGFYSPDQTLTQASTSYLEQFAAYDPPAGGGTPRVVADYSGITGKLHLVRVPVRVAGADRGFAGAAAPPRAQAQGERGGGQQEQHSGYREPVPEVGVERQVRGAREMRGNAEDQREPDQQQHAGESRGDAQVVDPRHRRQLRRAVPEHRHDRPVGQHVERHEDQVVADDRAGEPDDDADWLDLQQGARGVPGERGAAEHGEQVQRIGAVPAPEPAHVNSGRSGWPPTWCCARQDCWARSPAPGSRGRARGPRR